MTMRRPVAVDLGRGEDARAFGLGILEMAQQHVGIGRVEVPAAEYSCSVWRKMSP
jgi:hypothetical protein